MANTRWQESTEGFTSIDREAGVIRGVKVLGLQSRNKNGKRRYLKEATEGKESLYEGRKIYIDHVPLTESKAKANRPTKERWGKLQDVTRDEIGELWGDLHYLKSHAMTESILEAAERFNDFGLSHDAGGKVREERGEDLVYELSEVYSVDIVQEPATNRNLFESVEPMSRKNIRKALQEHIKQPAATYLLSRLTEMGDMYDEAMDMEVAAEATPEEQVKEAFKTAIMAILDGDYETEEAIDKIRKLLDVQAEIGGEKPAESSVPPTEGDTMTEAEIKQLRAEITQLREEKEIAKTREACTRILEEAGREVTDVRVKAMAGLVDEADRKALAESFPAKNGQRPATSPSRIREQQDDVGGTMPRSHEELKKLLGV